MILGREAIARLIPHAGAMCLLDTVEEHDAQGIVCTTRAHVSPTNPLRRDGRLSSVHAIEFAAQATAVHGALNMPPHSPPQPGMLVSVRRCELHCESLDAHAGALVISARRLAGGAELSMYDFTVASQEGCLVSGRLSIFTGAPA